MIKIAVLADDLTGAADTGVQFARLFGSAHLMPAANLAAGSVPDSRALSVFTVSRSLPPREAGLAAAWAAQALKTAEPEWIYKKIDSCMRGNVGAEVEAMLDRLDRPVSFIVPAFPDQGRTTVDGVHLVKGVPVHETEMGRDPVHPVPESSLAALVGRQSRAKIARIDLKTLEAGPDGLAAKVRGLIHDGARHIVFDSVNQAHLDAIADLAVNRFPAALPVGSAGLAASLSALLASDEVSPPGDLTTPGPKLFICGSASTVLREQVDHLVAHRGAARLILDPIALVQGDGLADQADQAVPLLAQGGLALQIKPPTEAASSLPGDEIVAGLANLAAMIVDRSGPGVPAGLFLSGGDSAMAAMSRFGVQAIDLQAEVQPGLVQGLIVGGRLEGRSVVTKSGAFGRPEALTKLSQTWLVDRFS